MPEGAHDIVAGGLAARRGPLVKRLRHRPLTPVTRVRFPHGSPEEVTCREAFHEIEPGGVETRAGQRAKVPKAHHLRNLEPQARGRRKTTQAGIQRAGKPFERASPQSGAPAKPGSEHMAGVNYAEVPPVPIPNTEVKLSSAENTWWVTAREDRSMPASAAVQMYCGTPIFLLSSVGRACGC